MQGQKMINENKVGSPEWEMNRAQMLLMKSTYEVGFKSMWDHRWAYAPDATSGESMRCGPPAVVG